MGPGICCVKYLNINKKHFVSDDRIFANENKQNVSRSFDDLVVIVITNTKV